MILLVSNTAYNIFHYRKTVWRALLNEGYEVGVIAAPDAYVEELRATGIRYYSMPALSNYRHTPWRAYSLYRQLRQLYVRLQPELILHFTIQANTFGSLAAGRLRIPSVATITGLGTTWLRSRLSRWLVSLLYRWTLPSATLVVTQNEDDRQDLIAAGVKLATWRSIPGSGVDTEAFRAREQDKLPDRMRFLFLGRMLVDKGVRELFAAWDLACKEGLHSELHLVGDRPAGHPRLVPETDWVVGLNMPNVTYHPVTRDARTLIQESHFVVLPSYREGLSLTLLESMAMETPVIATLVPGCRELVNDGTTGYGVPARSVRPLADAMLAAGQVDATEWRRMGRNGRRLIETKYSAIIVAGKYLDLVKKYASGPSVS